MSLILPLVELILMDGTGSTSAVAIRVQAGSTLSDADAAATALASVVLPLTGCVLVRQRITYRSVVDIPGVADSGISVKHAGVFYFDATDPEPGSIITIPGILDTILTPTNPLCPICIDLTNSDVTAFASAVIDNGACNPFGDALTALFYAYLESRV